VDWEARTLSCEDIFKKHLFELEYDYLVVATGCKTNTFGTPGVEEREGKDVFFLKHLHHARQIRNRILECFERAAYPDTSEEERARLLSFVVVGGGPTSCEFVGELHDFVTEDVSRWYPDLKEHIKITLLEGSPRLMGSFDETLSSVLRESLLKRRVQVRT
jgi:NADH dehydrogenase/NADH:ubiquinone reductase (non-electrogenic)